MMIHTYILCIYIYKIYIQFSILFPAKNTFGITFMCHLWHLCQIFSNFTNFTILNIKLTIYTLEIELFKTMRLLSLSGGQINGVFVSLSVGDFLLLRLYYYYIYTKLLWVCKLK